MNMEKRQFVLLILGFFIFTQAIAQDNKTDYINFDKTKALIEVDLDSAYTEIQFFKNTATQYNYLLGLYFKKKKEYKKSKAHLLYSIRINEEKESDKYLDAYYHLAYNYRRLGMLDSAQYYFSEILRIEKNKESDILKARALGGLGIVFRQKNEIDSAIHYVQLANIEYKKLNDTTGLARVQNSLGNLYRPFDVKLAIKHYLKALNYYETLNSKREIAVIKQNLGLIFTDEGKYEMALKYLKDALQLFVKENYLHYEIICLNNIGFTYLNLEQYSNAEKTLLKAVNINSEYYNALAFSYTNLGTSYNLEKKYSEAEKYLIKALPIAKENNNEYLLLEIYYNLISASSALGENSNVNKYLEAYNKLNEDIQNKDIELALAKYENKLKTIESENLLKLAIKDKKLREREIEENKTELFNKNILLALGIIIIILLIFIVGTIFKSNKKQAKLNIDIQKKNTIINKYNTELESVIEERTAELIVAMEKAKESDLLKSTFLANISHEIRTPLNSVMGFSDLLCDTDVDKEDVNKYGEIIRRKGFELLNIIDDIIDVSKIEANMFVCKLEKVKHFDIITAIETENFEKVKYFNKENEIEFTTNFINQKLSIKTDLYKLNVVFNKLINNAFQFTEKGFVNISSEVVGNQICFSISDSGIGIPKENLPQILENFRNFRKNEHLKYRGLGVGLYIANSILTQMGSQLEIKANEFGGSNFSFKMDIINE